MRRVTVPSDRIVVVGAGASALIVDLLAVGYSSIDAVDISAAALGQLHRKVTRDRSANTLRTIRSDVRELSLDEPVDLWHDRAVFHFLTDTNDQRAYEVQAAAAVRPGGHLVIATFSSHGPEQCSGLATMRHSANSLMNVFGEAFTLVETFETDHRTPWGSEQSFLHALLRRAS